MSNATWSPLWPHIEPRIVAAQPNRRLPKPNADGWIGPLRSPLREDSHPSFSVKPDSPTDPGAFIDYGSGAQGPMSDLAAQLGIDPRVSIVTPAPTSLTLSTFCDQRKLDPAELVKHWRAHQVQWMGRPALRYPTTLGIDRIKYLDSRKPKYGWARSGGETHWYGLQEALALPGPIYLVNGEPAVWAAQQAGVAAICLCAGEGTEPTPEQIAALQAAAVTEVRVVYDLDERGRAGAAKVVAALRAGGLAAVALELPPELGNGGDVDDLHRWEGAGLADALAALPELRDQATEPPRRRYLLEDEIDLLQPPTWLIKDVVPAGEVTMIIGAGDTGKTFITLDMVKRVARHYPVMYVAAEDASGIKLRKRAWELFHQVPKNGNFLMWNDELPLFDAGEVQSFIDEVRGLGLQLIVVDTLSQSIAGADENSSKDMTIVMQHCQWIARETGAAVVVIHHTTKGGEVYRGSSTILNNTYGLLQVSRDDDLIKFECSRIKNAKAFAPRFFRLVEVATDITDPDGQLLTSCVIMPADRVARGDTLTRNELKMLEALALLTDAQGGAKTSELERVTGLTGNSFYKPLKRLRGLELAEKAGKSKFAPLVITDEGRSRLATETTDPEYQTSVAPTATAPAFEVNTRLGEKLPNYHGSFSAGSNPESTSTDAPSSHETTNGFSPSESQTTKTTTKLPEPSGSNELETSYHSPPLKGRVGGSNSGSSNGSVLGTSSEVEHDRRRIAEVRASLAAGDIKQARRTVKQIRGNRDRLDMEADIDAAEAAGQAGATDNPNFDQQSEVLS